MHPYSNIAQKNNLSSKKGEKMKIYIDKMRVEIDLRENNESITRQILNGFMKITENDMPVRRLYVAQKTKNMINADRIKQGITNEPNNFCTAEYIIDDTLPSYIVVLVGYADLTQKYF